MALRIIITGDFCLNGQTVLFCEEKKYDEIYGDALSILRTKDLSITNLESPLTNSNSQIDKTGPSIKSSPDCIDLIQYGGFDVACLANNHILDYGATGLDDTLLACSSVNIKTVGAGSNLNAASKPLFIDSCDTKVAIVNIAENEFSIAGDQSPGANPLDPVNNYYQILDAKKKASVVVVIIHGGNEYNSLPSPMQVKIYRFFAELGATVIIGHHPHCYSGYEIYKGVPIFYSLGNFIFNPGNIKPDPWYEGFFVRLEIDEGAVRKYEIFPYFQCKGKPGLKLMREIDEERFNERIFKLSQIIQNDSELTDHWIRFCHKQEKYYLPALLGLNKVTKRLQGIKSLRRLIINKRRLLKLRNVITCEAHRNACLQVIDNLLSMP